ncbi:DUF664 domain-containing protein [Streptomyces oceani]|uniref:mycothiol transferase n=1 Tax=Streptomyces oceani TaxID=1075402 RepID=UPI000B2AA709
MPPSGLSPHGVLRHLAALERWWFRVQEAVSLDETGIRRRDGQPIALRGIMVDMIAEYARHNGHADLPRERLDGGTRM